MNLQQQLLQLFQQHHEWAVLISLLASIFVAVAGVLPSVFITAANIYFFGFTNGLLLSIAGESIGAAVSFVLYRYFFREKMNDALLRFPSAKKLTQATGLQGAIMVVALRLLPMVPSGIITFAAAIGNISTTLFVIASTMGKAPALLLEAALVQGFLQAGWPVQALMIVAAAILLFYFLRRKPSE